MSDTQKRTFSFAKPGAAPAQPVEATPVAPVAANNEAIPANSAANTQNLPATVPQYDPPAFYTGEEGEPSDATDQRLPRLNIVQKSSQAGWLAHGIGSLLLKGEVLIAKAGQPIRLVAIGARPKLWIEKTKFGGSVQPRFAKSIDEVVQLGGTDQWKFSKENDRIQSAKPWFMPSVTLAFFVEKPADLAPEFEGHFAYVVGDKAYAPALFAAKSTNYDAVWVTIASERRGLLSKGYNSRYINAVVNMKAFKGGESGVFKLAFGEETSPELRALADKLVHGS